MEKLWQQVPLLRIAVVFIIGIIAADKLSYSQTALWIWSCTTFLFTLLTVFLRSPIWASLCLHVAVGALGGSLLTLTKLKQDIPFPNHPIDYEAVLMSQPVKHGKVVRFDMLITSEAKPYKVRATLLCDTIDQRYLRLNLGDGIRAYSTLEKPRNFKPGFNFDYARWMTSQSIVAQTFINRYDWEKARIDYSDAPIIEKARIRALIFRRKLVDLLDSNLDNKSALSVIAALSLGEKQQLDKSKRETFSIAGASHILALSGLHLGIIYFLLRLIFPRKRFLFTGAFVILLCVWFYAFLVGMSPSIVRASLTISLYEIISLLRRNTIPMNTLAFAALVILIANPLALWDVGFQMSFCALLAILIYFRPIYNLAHHRIRYFKPTAWLWATIVLSLVAQIGVAPLVMYYFGRFSTYFAITNIFVVPLTYAILIATLFFFLSTPVPTIQHWIATQLQTITVWLDKGVQTVAQWPGSSIENIQINAWQVFGFYLLMAGLTLLFIKIRQIKNRSETLSKIIND